MTAFPGDVASDVPCARQHTIKDESADVVALQSDTDVINDTGTIALIASTIYGP